MAVDERRRMQLFEQLAAVIGDEATGTVFELLPPPNTEVATRDDLEGLRREMQRGFEEVSRRFDRQSARFDRVDEQFDRVDERFARVDERFAGVDERFEGLEERLTDRLSSLWRRDLLLVSGAQFSALAAAVIAVVQLG